MAKEASAHRISADQLLEQSDNRDIIPCTLSSDIGLGGGIPLGCTVVLGGRPGSGKTSKTLQYAANAQNMFGSKVFFFNVEGRLGKLVMSQIRGLKTDIDHFEVVMPPAITNKSGEVVGYQKWSAEKWWDEIGCTIENNPKSVVIVDSIASLSSEREISEAMGYSGRGDKQKIEAQFCRHYGDLVIPNQVAFFCLTQVQANTSGYGAGLQMKAGNALQHQADALLFCKRIDKWDANSDGKILGHNIIFEVQKSPLGPPFVTFEVPLRYGYGIDTTQDIIKHALNWGMIKRNGAWYSLPYIQSEDEFTYSPVESTENPVKVQGEAKLHEWMINHPDQLKEIDDRIRQTLMLN